MAVGAQTEVITVVGETAAAINTSTQDIATTVNETQIRELRARAEKALGESFDVRAFHDAVLENGAVPLAVLEERIDAFIAAGGR